MNVLKILTMKVSHKKEPLRKISLPELDRGLDPIKELVSNNNNNREHKDHRGTDRGRL
jgi:hypothetical protein